MPSLSSLLLTIEANVVCVIILIFLLNRQQSALTSAEVRIVWNALLSAQIFYCLSEIARILLNLHVLHENFSARYLILAVNFSLLACVCWLTFLYTELCQKAGLMKPFLNKILSAGIFIFTLAIIIIAPFTKAVINLSDGTLSIGLLFYFMVMLVTAYPVVAMMFALLRRKKMTRYERAAVPVISIFPALIIPFVPLQAVFWQVPLMCYAIVIADLFMYMNYADSLVSVDPMTKIPNRNGLIRNLSERLSKIQKENSEEPLYLFAVDVDNLGAINSKFGRSEGDRALILIAGALKKFSEEAHECNPFRYYGDEFMIIADINDDEELEIFVERVRNYISNLSTTHNLHYHLRVSIGYAKYERYSRTETISGLIEEAGRMLAENQEQRKFQNLWHFS